MKLKSCVCVIISIIFYAQIVLPQDFEAQVIKVVDGDTIHVTYNHEKIKIRLYGIDAPEMNQPYGIQSKEFLESLLYNKTISVHPHGKDRYKRTIATIFLEEKDIQGLLIENGLAWVYPKYCKKRICDTWKELEENAHAKKIGLWGAESSKEKKLHVAPWEWRRWRKG